jgi:hypothetical protein
MTGEVVVRLSFPEGQMRDLSWSGEAVLSVDRRTLAVCESSAGEIMLFEMRTGKLRGKVATEGRYLRGLLFLPEGRLVSAGDTALIWSIGLPRTAAPGGKPLGERELSELWTNLADEYADRAWPAMMKLASVPAGVVEFAAQRIRPEPRAAGADLDRIFRGLDSSKFREREEASRELDSLGAAAVARVQARLKKGVSEEVRRRAEQFLAKHAPGGPDREELRALRAVEVLEAIGSQEAKKLLGELAKGNETARLTQDAVEALQRLRPR